MYSLHAHTDGSNTRLLDCINKVEHLIDTAHNIGLKGVAITDHENIVNHVKAQKHLAKRKKENPDDASWQNFKLILGNEIYLCRNDLSELNFDKEKDAFFHFILLALDEEGHKQIRELSTRAFKHSWYRNMRRVPTYYRDIEEVIGANPGHVWGSTACLGSYFARCVLTNNISEGKNFIDWCQKIFGENFSLELQPINDKDQEIVNTAAYHTAIKRGIPFIATTDAHYLRPEDRKIHKAFLNSKGGDRETDLFYATTYLMTKDETVAHLKADYALQACENTNIIGDKVQEYSLLKDTRLPYMPLNVLAQLPLPDCTMDMKFLRKFYKSDCDADRQLANKIIQFINSNEDVDLKRIEIELESIAITDERMNQKWSKYLLQVADYVDIFWKDGDTIVGPARGSGAGFYINFILEISQIDPTKEKARMYPWRFLNPERASILDIDTDIQGNRRNKCIRALKNKYGEFRAVEVATFGTEKAKSAIKTACRGLNIDVDIATYLSSFIESDRGMQRSLHQTFYGDEENGFPVNRTFRTLMTHDYPQVWEVACRIEGLISRVGKHAGGVVIVDEDFTERAAIMTTNKDEFVSQFELHDLEDLGLIKIDLLAIEALDRVRACLDLLIQYDYIEKKSNLKDTYEAVIGVYNLERTEPKMWEMVWRNEIISLFQMEQNSGIQAISLTLPESLEDLAAINSVMRLMASERGAEQPLNKYARFKDSHPVSWEQEMVLHGLNKEERQLMHDFLDYEYGICATQEDLMSMVQHPDIGGFSVAWADKLRKAIAKKHPKEFDALTVEFFQNAQAKGLSKQLTEYVWNVLFVTQKGYSFNLSHTLAYSIVGLQEMNLAYKFPILFWNCANVIVDSMAADLIETEDYEDNMANSVDDDEEDEDEKEEKASPVEYGKIAKAIGKMKTYGVSIHLPDINKSKLTFFPSVEDNSIYYGLKGISKINDHIAEEIVANRPYTSLNDLLSKVKLNKPQVVSLIKSGALDSFGDRFEMMQKYISTISDTKTKLTLQNMQMLLTYELIPEHLDFEKRVFNFNKYLKKNKLGDNYIVDATALAFYEQHFNMDLLSGMVDGEANYFVIYQKDWDKIYKKHMETVKTFIKANEVELLEKLNWQLMSENWNKYALGSLSKWEMDSVSFYQHDHELERVPKDIYSLSSFYKLDEEPVVDYSFTTKDGYEIKMNQLFRIAGTVLAKDKAKGLVSILTTDGVVNVKIHNSQFGKYDKQISVKLPTGKKKVIEKSWFSRGNKVIFTGIRRGPVFVPKVYKKSEWQEPIQLITAVDDNGFLELKTEREAG